LTSNVDIVIVSGATFTPLQAGFGPNSNAIANSPTFCEYAFTRAITALPDTDVVIRVVFPYDTTGVGQAFSNTINIVTFPVPSPLEFRVFKKRDLVTHGELEELKKAFNEMKTRYEEKEDLFSVISSVRNSSPVRVSSMKK